MKYICILSFLLAGIELSAQTPYQYKSFRAKKMIVKADSVLEAYTLRNVGIKFFKGNPEKFVVSNVSGMKLLEFSPITDASGLHPTFFHTRVAEAPVFMLVEEYKDEVSRGNTVFVIRENSIRKLGYIDAAFVSDSDSVKTPANISPYLSIVQAGNVVTFSFTCGKILTGNAERKTETVPSAGITYLFDLETGEFKMNKPVEP